MMPPPSPKQSKQFSQPTPSEKSPYLVIGKLRRPHGVRGEMLMDVITDFPERLNPGVSVFVGPQHLPLQIRSRRWHRSELLIAFEGYHTPEAVGVLRNLYVHVRADDRPSLPEGEYYHHQLLGMKVISDQGKTLGVLGEIIDTGANDVFVVHSLEFGEILLPYTDEVVININLERNEMHVRLLPGLLGQEQEE